MKQVHENQRVLLSIMIKKLPCVYIGIHTYGVIIVRNCPRQTIHWLLPHITTARTTSLPGSWVGSMLWIPSYFTFFVILQLIYVSFCSIILVFNVPIANPFKTIQKQWKTLSRSFLPWGQTLTIWWQCFSLKFSFLWRPPSWNLLLLSSWLAGPGLLHNCHSTSQNSKQNYL